jgi:hypothetical protein
MRRKRWAKFAVFRYRLENDQFNEMPQIAFTLIPFDANNEHDLRIHLSPLYDLIIT